MYTCSEESLLRLSYSSFSCTFQESTKFSAEGSSYCMQTFTILFVGHSRHGLFDHTAGMGGDQEVPNKLRHQRRRAKLVAEKFTMVI